MEYTKGEWAITECAMQAYGEPIQHFLITPNSGEFSGRTLADIGLWRDFPEDMVRANAQLIASAPDLYEALKGIICLGGELKLNTKFKGGISKVPNNRLNTGIEALAKAEGGK